ncbi:MAG: flagellar hook-associated protein FlgK [Burkholderiales bacterium]
MSALMSIGKTAMSASYAALQTTGNNIANANTVGYSRQQVVLADAPSQFTGSGFFGKGVNVTTVSRAYNQYLTSQAINTGSVSAADSARLDKLTQLENVFPIGESGLGYAAGALMNSFVDVANNPSDASARQVTLSQAQELAARFKAGADQLNDLQTGVTQDVKASVASLNTMAQSVAKLNQQIASLKGSGQAPNQLLDQRDQLITKIAATINITTISADDGSVGVFIGGGQNLVLGANANTIKAVPDTFDPAKVMLTMNEGATNRLIPTDGLVGGSLAGLMKFQNEDMTSARNLLGQMAAAVSGAVNTQQSLGLDLGQPASAGAPIFSVGAPRVLAAADNNGTATLTATTIDASKLQASDYALGFDGANYTLTRSFDQSAVTGSPFTPAQLAAGVTVDGVTLTLTGGTAASGDRFLVQPVATAADSMQSVLGSSKGIAAASPFTGSLGVNNTGTATLNSLVAVTPGYNGALSASIAFTSNTGNYTWTMSDATTGTGTWTAGTPISLNGFELSLDGVPRSGDTVSVVPTTATASNNGNALAFAALGKSPIVSSNGAGASSASSLSITDAYASALASVGVRVQGGQTAATMSSAAASQAETARANEDGVNLDEEAARLIQFQQSYQAAAKILQVAQAVFDTMLQTAAG